MKCSNCSVEKTEAEFYIYKRSGKLRSSCKSCTKFDLKVRRLKRLSGTRKVGLKTPKDATVGGLLCSKCKKFLPTNKFYLSSASIYSSKCIDCNSVYAQKYYKYRKRYGVSADSLNDTVKKQKNCCAVCDAYFPDGLNKQPNGSPKGLCVDHDHQTGRVRGILCFRCNLAAGYVLDTPIIASKLAAYLESHT